MVTGKRLSCENLAIMIVVLGVLGVCLLGVVGVSRSRQAAAPFEAYEEQARAACTQCLSLREESAGASTPYRRGKVLIVEADTGEVTLVPGMAMADLPVEIRATSWEEVGTIVCAGAVQQTQVSSYQDREPAYQLSRDVCIYDLTTEEVILFDTLQGGSPPPVKTVKGPKSGSDPALGVLTTLLKELPVE